MIGHFRRIGPQGVEMNEKRSVGRYRLAASGGRVGEESLAGGRARVESPGGIIDSIRQSLSGEAKALRQRRLAQGRGSRQAHQNELLTEARHSARQGPRQLRIPDRLAVARTVWFD